MIPNATDTVEVQSSLTGETGQFTVDENSLTKIMSVLTNLYSDPELAVTREYLTNALDAQIEAQENDPNYVWRPIEVTLPTRFQSSYSIRDFGIGMSVDDLKEVYSKYGKSTKETSNTVTGMLGLGSKCALTYTGQFTITGWKNGIKTVALVSKDENDVPTFMIVDTCASDEPNGVEISVPVKDRNSFAEKTRELLRWWEPGQVLVDGQEPTKHGLAHVQTTPVTYKVGDKQVTANAEVYLIESAGRYYEPQSYVIMGNVPYKVDSEYVDESLTDAGMGFAAYVPMGSVSFPPSREVLTYNPRTKATIGSISKNLFESILAKQIEKVSNETTFLGAWKAHYNLPHHFKGHHSVKSLQFRGLDFPHTIDKVSNMVLDWDHRDRGNLTERNFIHMTTVIYSSIIVTGVVPGSKPTAHFKRKVRHYIEEKGYDYERAILVKDDPTDMWLSELPRVSAETIKAIKLPRAAGGTAPRAEVPFDYYDWDKATGSVVFKSEVKVKAGKRKIAYVSPADLRETRYKRECRPNHLLSLMGDKWVLVVTGQNRWEKFLREHPGAVHLKDAVQQILKEKANSVTDAQLVAKTLEYREREFLSSQMFKADDILDPELADLCRAVRSGAGKSPLEEADELISYVSYATIRTEMPVRTTTMKNVAGSRYPLIKQVYQQPSHLLIYVNAAYQNLYAPKP